MTKTAYDRLQLKKKIKADSCNNKGFGEFDLKINVSKAPYFVWPVYSKWANSIIRS